MVGVGRRQVADQCQQRPLVALHEAAERLDVCRQHPPDRIEVIVHGALPCGTELPLKGYTAGPGKSSPGLEGPEASTNDLTTRSKESSHRQRAPVRHADAVSGVACGPVVAKSALMAPHLARI